MLAYSLDMVLLPVFSTASGCRTLLLLLQCWQDNAAKPPLSTSEELRAHWFQYMTLLPYDTSRETKCKLTVCQGDGYGPPCLNTGFYTSFASYYKHNIHCHVNLKPHTTFGTQLCNAIFNSLLKKVIIMISRHVY